ncbi:MULTISPECIES: class I SAM-dependent methyltransferase [unclassified Saccharicrinis]|uniref:class I SAM-dependent methyltransferase n=1 Tax=unclassified Saccharicrinis TaxID=2646859 RepID=UPI003D351D8A
MMNTRKRKESVRVTKEKKVFNVLYDNGKIRKYKPWLGDMFSFLYNMIMDKSVFPNKFNGSIQKHFEILKGEFQDIHHQKILDIAAGSGNAVEFLRNDNSYIGTDISSGLLGMAAKKFNHSVFENAEFYVTDANNMPFGNNFFDLSLCHLTLNFFTNIDNFILELKRVLKPGGIFFSGTPTPEKKKTDVKIGGTLYAEDELKEMF